MLVSARLTVGQITFVLRAAIQILAYGGLFLISIIILSRAPRIASLQTHDVVNRIVSADTVTKTSLKWIFNRLRGRTGDPVLSTGLLFSITLLTVYSLFVSLSDLGFLGFDTCVIPDAGFLDRPSSLNTSSMALSAIQRAMVNGTDPSTVRAYRCDAVEVVQFDTNVFERNCSAWHNSSYADPNLFSGLNTTDSDVLIPFQLQHRDQPRQQFIDLNSFWMGFGSKRITTVTQANGIVVDPHKSGFRAVFGAPDLAPQRSVILDKTLALEVDVGCVNLGIVYQHNVEAAGDGFEFYDTNWDQWNKYTGPDYMRDVLLKTAADIREYFLPLFNQSSLYDGILTGINGTLNSTATNIAGPAAKVASYFLPNVGNTDGVIFSRNFTTNCSTALSNKLGVATLDKTDSNEQSCGLFAITGSFTLNSTLYEGVSRMVCATASQVNMVSANIASDVQGTLNMTVTRLPSDLNYLRADYWDATQDSLNASLTNYVNFLPIERFTLADNPNGPTSHFIFQYSSFGSIARSIGPGSPGNTLSRIGTGILNADYSLINSGLPGLIFLDEGMNQVPFNTSMVTRWGGQVGASFLLQSLLFNGWAAESAKPVLVSKTAGKLATCYSPKYAIGFAPLLISAALVVVWSLFLCIRAPMKRTKMIKNMYEGLTPFQRTIWASKDTLLSVQATPEPHLEVLPGGQPIVIQNGEATAIRYLNTPTFPHPPMAMHSLPTKYSY